MRRLLVALTAAALIVGALAIPTDARSRGIASHFDKALGGRTDSSGYVTNFSGRLVSKDDRCAFVRSVIITYNGDFYGSDQTADGTGEFSIAGSGPLHEHYRWEVLKRSLGGGKYCAPAVYSFTI